MMRKLLCMTFLFLEFNLKVPNFSKKESEGDDLYDAAIEPSGPVNEKRESTEDHLQNSVSRKHSVVVKAEPAATQQAAGKRYCCYIGNMTWWTTDVELEVYFHID